MYEFWGDLITDAIAKDGSWELGGQKHSETT